MKRRSRMGRAAPARQPSSAVRANQRWIGAGVLFSAGITALWVWHSLSAPRIPAIPTQTLNASTKAMLEEDLAGVRAAPRSGAAWGRLGALLRSLEFGKEARYCLEIAQQLDPAEARWPHLLGLQLRTEQPRKAVVCFRQAAELCGVQPQAPRLWLAKLLAETAEWTEMEQALRPLLQVEPEHGPALLASARAAQARGDWDLAISLATRSARDSRSAAGSWSLLAALYQRQGLADKAIVARQEAARAPPDAPIPDPFDAEAAFERGDARQLSDRVQQLLTSRRLPEAAPLIQRLLREHPEYSEGWLLLGRWYLLQNQLPQAQQAIQHHLELEPRSVNGLFQLGLVQIQQQLYADALTNFVQATWLKPDFGPGFFNLGFVLLRLGRKAEAVTALREAIRHSPEHLESYLLLADLYGQLGRKEEALALIHQAEAMNPNDRRLAALKETLERQ